MDRPAGVLSVRGSTTAALRHDDEELLRTSTEELFGPNETLADHLQ